MTSFLSAYSNQNEYETKNISYDVLTNGELHPAKFHGISVSSFGNTRRNPFNRLKQLAMDEKIPVEDRMRAVRYMDRIPHKDKVQGTSDAAISIIENDSISIGERYFFFSNNEKLSKLSDQVVKRCHVYFFTAGANHSEWPTILRLLSAAFIYMTELHHQPIWTTVREYIIKRAMDSDESVHVRSEAADVLSRLVTSEDRKIGMIVIQELGDLYLQNKMNSIYTNAQNAHNEAVTESVMSAIRHLLVERNRKELVERNVLDEKDGTEPVGFSAKGNGSQNTGEILERIMVLILRLPQERKDHILGAFNLILVHPARYEGITLSDVLGLVWNKIVEQKDEVKAELEQRLLQELYDMDQTCASGLCSRLVNVLSGYVEEEELQIKMNVKDQLRANVFARLRTNLKLLPRNDQDKILAEISEDISEKPMAKEFITTYSVQEELEEEFVTSNLISQLEFETIYYRCIDDFLGLEAGLVAVSQLN